MIQSDQHHILIPLKSGLQDRVVVPPYPQNVRAWQIVYLQTGTLDLRGEGAMTTTLYAPGLICHPVTLGQQLRIRAGSSGVHVALNQMGMNAALGANPESAEIRQMVRSTVTLALGPLPEVAQTTAVCVGILSAEMDQPAPGHVAIFDAQLRCLLVYLWRHSQSTGDTIAPDGTQTILLRQFRQLVEARFRSRWRVADYAQALGTSPDRLHNVATTALGRTPLSLIHERLLNEAKALLTRSNMTLDQISAELGFHSAAQFSAFFRKGTGQPPGQFRTAYAEMANASPDETVAAFTDWP